MNESQPTTADPLDRLMAMSLKARPEAKPVANLAERAIERARMLDRVAAQQQRNLTVYRWRLRCVHTAAALLIALLVLAGGKRLMSERQSVSSSDDATISTESPSSNTGTYLVWIGGLLFICTVAGLATESAIAPERSAILV